MSPGKAVDISFSIIKMLTIKWASMQENLLSGFANNKGADQPAHMRSLISAIVVRLTESIMSRHFTREFSML